MSKKIIISESQLERVVKLVKEDNYFDDDGDKWADLEKDLRYVVERLIKRYRHKWNDDQYAVISAIGDVFENMFERVRR